MNSLRLGTWSTTLFVLAVAGCSSSNQTTATPGVTRDSGVTDSGTAPSDSGLSAQDSGTVVDDSGAPGSDGGTVATACTSYPASTVAAMRGGKSGCYELDNVVSIALTPSKTSPKLFVQDAAGGDFSAVEAKCSSTSAAHPCSVASAVAAIAMGHSVTIQGTYIKSKTTSFEEFYVSTITDHGAATTVPAPAAVTLAEIERGAMSKNLWFQKVTTTIAAADALTMFDWTPAEFVYTGATKCPYQFGWGMVPTSAGATGAGMACSSGTAQPAGVASPPASEILVSSAFYKDFTMSSDCRCAKMYSDTEPSATSTVTGAITAVLSYELPQGGTTGYQLIMPISNADFPMTNTVAGM